MPTDFKLLQNKTKLLKIQEKVLTLRFGCCACLPCWNWLWFRLMRMEHQNQWFALPYLDVSIFLCPVNIKYFNVWHLKPAMVEHLPYISDSFRQSVIFRFRRNKRFYFWRLSWCSEASSLCVAWGDWPNSIAWTKCTSTSWQSAVLRH